MYLKGGSTGVIYTVILDFQNINLHSYIAKTKLISPIP